MTNYHGTNLKLTDTELTDDLGSISVNSLSEAQLDTKFDTQNTTPLVDSLIQIACKDVEQNIVTENGNTYFGAGRTFGAAVFTRDICFSGILSLNEMYPEIMRKSLEFTRNIRRETAFKVDDEQYIIEGVKADWKLIKDPAEGEFRAGCITRRTDDVVFLWGMADWIEKNGNKTQDWEWLYDIGCEFFETMYQPFYDSNDDLYKGQAAFIDVHFPTFKANGYPLDWSISDCCQIKALSTNCLYKIGMDKMSKAAAIIGKKEEAELWSNKASKIQKAIINELTLEDGTLAYYKDKNNEVPNRREALGTALAVFANILSPEQAKHLMSSYPKTEHGAPLIVPAFDHSEGLKKYEVHYDGIYHNQTTWPFVDAIFSMAYEMATGDNIKPYSLAVIARTCRDQSSFREVTNFITKEPYGSHSQLWTAAAFLNVCLRDNKIQIK